MDILRGLLRPSSNSSIRIPLCTRREGPRVWRCSGPYISLTLLCPPQTTNLYSHLMTCQMTDNLSSYGVGLARTGIPSGYTLTICPYGCVQFCLLSYTSQLVIMCSTSVTSCATCHLATRPKTTRMSSVTHLTFEIRQKRCVTYTLLRIVTPGGCSSSCVHVFPKEHLRWNRLLLYMDRFPRQPVLGSGRSSRRHPRRRRCNT